MSKALLITHKDLDGVGCQILFRLCKKDGAVERADNKNVTEVIFNSLIKLTKGYIEELFITDLPVNENITDFINSLDNHLIDRIKVIDHHLSSEYIKLYKWAFIDNSGNECGTSLMYKYLLNNGYREILQDLKIKQFVDLVKEYDTWKWIEHNNINAKYLNDLYYIYGVRKFVDRILNKFNNKAKRTFELDSMELERLKEEQDNIMAYCRVKLDRVIFLNWFGYMIGVVFAERYINDVAEFILSSIEHIDIVMIIQPDYGISLRTKRDDINLSDLAILFGGGGHRKAAGIPLKNEEVFKFVTFLIENKLSFTEKSC